MTSVITLTYHGLEGGRRLDEKLLDNFARKYMVQKTRFLEGLGFVPPRRCSTVAELSSKPNGDWLCLTFDDGLSSDADVAVPALIERGLRGTFFVTVENIGRPGYCGWKDLAGMIRLGMEIGSHGLTHRPLTRMDRVRAADEIQESKVRLEEGLGVSVSSFAPVGGHYRAWMVNTASRAGYTVFATMIPGRTRVDTPPLLLRRNHVLAEHNANHVMKVLEGRRGLLAALRLRYQLLLIPKKLIGLGGYERVKAALFRLQERATRTSVQGGKGW